MLQVQARDWEKDMNEDMRTVDTSDPVCPHCFEVALETFYMNMKDCETKPIICRKCNNELLVDAFVYYTTRKTK